MANRDVFPTANWQWPDPTQVSGAANAARVQVDEVTQLRRDRDELVEALEGVLFHHQPKCLCALDFVCAACTARAVIARIKGGR